MEDEELEPEELKRLSGISGPTVTVLGEGGGCSSRTPCWNTQAETVFTGGGGQSGPDWSPRHAVASI